MNLYVLFCVSVKLVFSFNIDIDNIISFRGDNGTFFGYSAVLVNNSDGNWVVVGAPKAKFSDRPEITMPGNVYKCKINFARFQQEDCVPIPLRPTDTFRRDNSPGYEEDNQLLGASMAQLRNKIVICAPFWKNMDTFKEPNNTPEPHPYGRCHNLDNTLNTSNTKRFTESMFQEKYEFVEAGFSISSKESWDTHSVLLGAPGLEDKKGGFLRYSFDGRKQFVVSYTHKNISTDTKNSISNSTLMGYSIATGKISSHYNCPNVVLLGAPRFYTHEGRIGAVLLICMHSNTMDVKKQVFGKKHGSGFGSAIVFDDINNDGLDDLMVGAPIQFDTVIDSGVVYVYLGNANDILIENQKLTDAKLESARFGTALECVGDLNKDGYKDLVVGAPYQDNLSGAIYIYHGGPNQLIHAQTIRAADVDIRPVSFGWFISSPLDIDQNDYPDFAVGSYMSDTVSILRSRPIIKLSCFLKIDPPMIPLNSSGQQCQDDNFLPCANVEVCFNFSGVGSPEKIIVSYTINADTLRTNAIPSKPSRVSMYVNSTNHKSTITEDHIEVRKDGKTCRSLTAIVPIVTRQFLSALQDELRIEASFGLSRQPLPGQLKPILDNKPKIETASAMFFSGCNGTCHPNLKLEVSFEPNQIIFGSTTELIMQIRVTNHDEPSPGTRITIITTNNTNYLGYYQPRSQLTELGSCGEEYNASDLNCDLSRTLYQQQQGLFNVRFNVSQEILTSESADKFNLNRSIGFTIKATSIGFDRDSSDNVIQVNVSVKFVSELQLQGTSEPEQQRLSDLQNVSFTHKYDLYNTGPSPLKNGVVRICQPIIGDIEITSLKVNYANSKVNWKYSHVCPDETMNDLTKTKSTIPTSTLPMLTALQVDLQVQEDPKSTPKFKKISCRNVVNEEYVIFDVTINELGVGESTSFEIPIIIAKRYINFEKAYAIRYMTTGEVEYVDKETYAVVSVNTTFDVTTEIFPEALTAEGKEINIWIIISGCCGGVIMLVILGILLWKCGFFKRQKKEDVVNWKRQTGYYASRQSQMIEDKVK